MSQLDQLRQAIQSLEAQRSILGDSVVDASIAALRKQLAELEKEQPGEERKLVSVLFADLAGFTAMADKMDPEDLHEVQQAYFAAVSAPIREQGGWIEKYIGDAVVAVFGLPQAREDDPDRAVRAALGMQAALEALNNSLQGDPATRWMPALKMRVGVNTGLVIVHMGDEQTFSVTGDSVNLGSRLQSAAPPGGVLISQDTYRHVRGAFDLQELEPITVKGKSEALQVYLVTAVKQRSFRTRKRGVEGIEARMVGREGELGRLQTAYLGAIEDNEHGMLTIAGDPGLGKSRLLYEFENWVDLRPEIVDLFRGRARLETQGLPYSLWRDLFAFRFGVQDDDPLPAVWEKFEAGMREGGGEAGSRQIRAHLAGQLLGFDFSASPHVAGSADNPGQLRERGYNYLLDYFKAHSQAGLALLLLEDLHWADDASLSLLDWLAGKLSNRAVLIVATTRPALYEKRPHWMEGQIFHQRLDLQPLSKRESRLLVAELLQKMADLPEELRDLIVSNAEGNPFYVEELAKMLIEVGVIDKSGEAWRFNPEKLKELRVPPTLVGVLQARLDSLPAGERSVLQQASVVGRIFWDRSLVFLNKVSGGKLDEAEILQDLVKLRQREMLYLRENSAFSEAQELIFKHATLREVTYESLLKRVRRVYHRLVGEWLEETTRLSGRAEEYTGLIAEHYTLAGEVDRAIEWGTLAGDRARLQGAMTEAARFYQRALGLMPDEASVRRWKAITGLSLVYLFSYRLKERESLDEQALSLARRLGNLSYQAEVHARIAQTYNNQGEGRRAAQQYREALLLARQSGDRVMEARILSALSWVLGRLGETQAAVSAADEAVEMIQQTGDQKWIGVVLLFASSCFTAIGDLAKAAHYSILVMENYRQQQNLARTADAQIGLSHVYLSLGLVEKAKDELERALVMLQESDLKVHEADLLLNIGLACIHSQETELALNYLDKSMRVSTQIGDQLSLAAVLSYQGLALEAAGEPEQAALAFRQGLEKLQLSDRIGASMDARSGLARCLLALGKLGEALEYARSVWEFLQEQRGAGMEFPIRGYLTCARAFEAAGESESARMAMEQGYARLMEMAGLISDEEWRRSFLENLPWHREMADAFRD